VKKITIVCEKNHNLQALVKKITISQPLVKSFTIPLPCEILHNPLACASLVKPFTIPPPALLACEKNHNVPARRLVKVFTFTSSLPLVKSFTISGASFVKKITSGASSRS